jgi:hypothetical protein
MFTRMTPLSSELSACTQPNVCQPLHRISSAIALALFEISYSGFLWFFSGHPRINLPTSLALLGLCRYRVACVVLSGYFIQVRRYQPTNPLLVPCGNPLPDCSVASIRRDCLVTRFLNS